MAELTGLYLDYDGVRANPAEVRRCDFRPMPEHWAAARVGRARQTEFPNEPVAKRR